MKRMPEEMGHNYQCRSHSCVPTTWARQISQLDLGYANTITTASVSYIARDDSLIEQFIQDGVGVPSLTFSCVEITRGDKKELTIL
jgi:hypothetical protein